MRSMRSKQRLAILLDLGLQPGHHVRQLRPLRVVGDLIGEVRAQRRAAEVVVEVDVHRLVCHGV